MNANDCLLSTDNDIQKINIETERLDQARATCLSAKRRHASFPSPEFDCWIFCMPFIHNAALTQLEHLPIPP